jgi:hypothetical protein
MGCSAVFPFSNSTCRAKSKLSDSRAKSKLSDSRAKSKLSDSRTKSKLSDWCAKSKLLDWRALMGQRGENRKIQWQNNTVAGSVWDRQAIGSVINPSR